MFLFLSDCYAEYCSVLNKMLHWLRYQWFSLLFCFPLLLGENASFMEI